MNFQIPILLSVVVCALALPVPDEEVPILQKVTEALPETVTTADGLEKSTPSLSTVEEGTTTAVINSTGSLPQLDVKSEKKGEAAKETTTEALDDIKEEPKTLPVKAREETEAAAPPFAGVRAEPKEGVEIGESKSKASSPGADEVEKKEEPKPSSTASLTTESTLVGSIEKKSDAPSTEEKSKSEGSENKPTEKPASPEANKTEPSATATETISTTTTSPKQVSKPTNKTDSKPTEGKEKNSTEANKSEESAESKESEESNESNKSK